jgi:hypothetical protein
MLANGDACAEDFATANVGRHPEGFQSIGSSALGHGATD